MKTGNPWIWQHEVIGDTDTEEFVKRRKEIQM